MIFTHIINRRYDTALTEVYHRFELLTKKFQILSLDGGGIKGLFSAALLAHIETDLEIEISRHFDLIVGTSTGGIIALGLGLGLRPADIIEFYVNEGQNIFPSDPGLFKSRRYRHWLSVTSHVIIFPEGVILYSGPGILFLISSVGET